MPGRETEEHLYTGPFTLGGIGMHTVRVFNVHPEDGARSQEVWFRYRVLNLAQGVAVDGYVLGCEVRGPPQADVDGDVNALELGKHGGGL